MSSLESAILRSPGSPAGRFVFNRIQMMKFPRTVAAAVAVVIVAGSAAKATAGQTPAGQTSQAPAAPASQQQINEEMLKELKAIRLLLERLTTPQGQPPPQPQTAKVANLKGYALGRPDAPLTMVEFTDLQCPFCRQFMLTSFDELKRNWIDTGKLRYISRDFPLDFHAQAMPAARAARCAGEQGKFWEMRHLLVRNANLLTPDYIKKTAHDLKLESKPFEECVASTKFDAEIQAETREGQVLGVGGTPTFVMGRSTAAGIEGPVMVGALPYSLFDQKLKSLLPPETK
jgi:protein-disulfide isomerase